MMDSGQLDPIGKCVDGFSSEHLFSPDYPGISGKFADPQVLPRVGSAYQVEIPPILTESERLRLLQDPADTETKLDVSHNFLMGLPIPVMWVDNEGNTHENGKIEAIRRPDDSVSANGSLGSKRAKKRRLIPNKKGFKSKPLDIASDNGKTRKSASKSCYLVPGLHGDASWTDVEVGGFLLSIYIFEKNLIQVKRFVETKEMGDILSFYYGKFYGSYEHKRYSGCRRMMKSRNCKIGQRICTGWRQQELLSRLLPRVSEEAKSNLVQVSKAFAEGRISLEDYIHTLKTLVGTLALIEAVRIGKGKEDLTNLSMEPTRNDQLFSIQPEIPAGKAWSSLTSSDIIKFLTGDFRLSKARSNDIFWEAVWPRLLGRGWHSEQPKNYFCYGSKHQLVFLTPGVKKFSRRKLVKGDHYFDSVSDVLSKVASDPVLIELEAETESIVENNADDCQPRCYLKPRVSTCSSNPATYTIVDTSSSCAVKSLKVTGLLIIPDDTKNTSSLNIHSKEAEGDCSGNFSMDKPQSADMLRKGHKQNFCDQGKCIVEYSNANQRMPINGTEYAKHWIQDHHYQDTDLSNFEQLNKFNRRVRPGCSNLFPPLMKRRKLASCLEDKSSQNKEKLLVTKECKEVKPNFMSNSSCLSEAVPVHEKAQLARSSPQCSPKKESSDDTDLSPSKRKKPQAQPLFDLNEPPIPVDGGNGEFCMMKLNDSLQNPYVHVLGTSSDKYNLVEPKVLSKSTDVYVAEKLPVVNPRRQSTRNRPLTIRALEAHASGFLGTKQKRKGRDSEMQSK
ncbi:hypothetical protein RHMOL_Rhmol07G0238600 [Rhododendron molle]|uniref:Uncharacterized protein n=1 Tax=Rhododendron molle TaxID=49168 RepID=A0ACC0N5A9_RHOML|nr:hypothetical protein RHMOL_Rhmol07G0238600 [Rhododendron molle]